MNKLQPKVLSHDQAYRLTERIRESVEGLWGLFLEAYEGRAWEALGYDSWREYAQTEFGMGQSHVYRLLDQGRVVQAIADASGVSPNGEISEFQARRLKPHLHLVTDEIEEAIEDGVDPQVAVDEAIDRHDQPFMVNGEAVVSKELVAEKLTEEKETNPLLPFRDALLKIAMTRNLADAGELIDLFSPSDQYQLFIELPMDLKYLQELHSRLESRFG